MQLSKMNHSCDQNITPQTIKLLDYFYNVIILNLAESLLRKENITCGNKENFIFEE